MNNKKTPKQILKLLKLLCIEALNFIKSKVGMLICGIVAAGLVISLLIGALFNSNTPAYSTESLSESISESEEQTSELITEAPDYTPEVPETSEADTESTVETEERLTLSNMEIPDTSWAYFLINRSNPVPQGYINNIEFKGVYSNYATFYLDSRAADFAQCMINDAEDDGVTLLICSAYRSHERQTANFENRVKAYASAKYSFASAYALTAGYIAVPGTSEHETGLAIDFITPGYTSLDSGFENTEAYKWLAKNSYKYGYILRYPSGTSELTGINYEPWHFRFIGFEHAQKIYESGLCLEEYMEKDRENNPDLKFTSLEALKIPAQPAWYEYYLNPPADTESESESDSVNSDSLESDSSESDSVDFDSAEPDSSESDSVESDSVESDSNETDSTETDSDETDSVESDSTDSESDSDSDETDSDESDSDSDESDSDESDIEETDFDFEDTYEDDFTDESDSEPLFDSETETESKSESDFETETEFSYKPITPEDLGIFTEEDSVESEAEAEPADTTEDTSSDISEDTDADTIEETDEIV